MDYRLVNEHRVGKNRLFEVLELSRSAAEASSEHELAYEGLEYGLETYQSRKARRDRKKISG